jgi:hypothetical protein
VQLTPSIAHQAVVARSICSEKFIRLLGEGSSLDHLIENAQRRAAEDPRSLAILAQDSTFAFKIDTIYGKTDRPEKQGKELTEGTLEQYEIQSGATLFF